jgi:hypothetical protein
MQQDFDFNEQIANTEMEIFNKFQHPKKHLTRDIISQFFEREKKLRSLCDEEREEYENECYNIKHEYIPLFADNSPFEENDKWGVRNNVLGTVLVTPAYDEVSDLADNYGYCKVRLGNKYGMVISTKNGGQMVLQPVYDQIISMDNYFGEENRMIGVIIIKDEKYGLSLGHNADLEPIYDQITITHGVFLTEKEGKYGMLGEELFIPAEYDEIYIPEVMGWIKARKGCIWVYFDVDGNFTTDITKAFQTKFKNVWELNSDIQNHLHEMFDNYASFLDSSLSFLSSNKQKETECPGNIENSKIFNKRILYKEYIPKTHSEKTGLRLFVTGTNLIPPKFDELQYITDNIYCYRLNGKYGLVQADGKGTELCPPQYDEIKQAEYLENILLVRIQQKWGIIDIYESDDYPTNLNYDQIMETHQGLDTNFLLKKENKWGVYTYGDVVPPVYDGIFIPEIFGWVRACKNGEWGYIDINNEFTKEVSKAFLCR